MPNSITMPSPPLDVVSEPPYHVGIATLRLAPTDVLVVHVPRYISSEQHARMREHFRQSLPPGAAKHVLILDGGMTLSTVTREALELGTLIPEPEPSLSLTLQALNVPKNSTKVDLHFEAGQVGTATCEYLPVDHAGRHIINGEGANAGLQRLAEQYVMVPRAVFDSLPELTQAEVRRHYHATGRPRNER